MRPIIKGNWPKDEDGNNKIYRPYGTAKYDLVNDIGRYCSFCDRRANYNGLDVEHILPKKYHSDLEENWDNFLLACTNCNSTKGTDEVDLSKLFMPHINNTAHIFKYGTGGLLTINKSLKSSDEEKAKKYFELVGVDRKPGHKKYSYKDLRWKERETVFTLAQRYLTKYERKECDEETVCDLAIGYGFWSVWMSVFRQHKKIKIELIDKFSGTVKKFFDTDGNTKPIIK
ncbi:MAG: hypothetical protein ACI81T_002866 [Bacteroidia bacterium]|jgi:uncharacterized protein (TIGR02646 family)